jgi:hypothetical protein
MRQNAEFYDYIGMMYPASIPGMGRDSDSGRIATSAATMICLLPRPRRSIDLERLLCAGDGSFFFPAEWRQ